MYLYLWNVWYSGGAWFLWFGIAFLLFSRMGYRRHTCAGRKKCGSGRTLQVGALDILKERYVTEKTRHKEFSQARIDI
jgi:hypothetical protein